MALDIFSYILGCTVEGGGGGSGKSTAFKTLTLEEDGTYTVVDWKDHTHTIEVTEENGQIVELLYDGEDVSLEFDEGWLTGIGESDVDISLLPEKDYNPNASTLEARKIDIPITMVAIQIEAARITVMEAN